jgi:hypothetical protein
MMRSSCSAGVAPVDSLFSPFTGHFPNNALGSEFTVEPRAITFAAAFNIQTLATRSAKTGFVFLTDGKGFTVGVVSTLHLFLVLDPRRHRRNIGVVAYPGSLFLKPHKRQRTNKMEACSCQADQNRNRRKSDLSHWLKSKTDLPDRICYRKNGDRKKPPRYREA